MPVPLFDPSNNFLVNHIPNYRRLPKWIQMLRGHIAGVSYLDFIFRRFMHGSDNFMFYSSAISYKKNDIIINKFAVYQSLNDGNISNSTDDETKWLKVLDSFVGLTEQTSYNCKKLPFEFFINHYFKQYLSQNGLIGFKNPTSIVGDSYSPNSDIYVNVIVPQHYSILGFNDLHQENTIFDNSVGFFAFDDIIFSVESFYIFSVNIPISVFGSVNSSSIISEKIFRQFIDKLCPSGIQYEIVTY